MRKKINVSIFIQLNKIKTKMVRCLMNPLLPENCFVPDVEARVMPDGRLYFCGSWDVTETNNYCTKIQHCFSTTDMKTWTDYGVICRNDKEFTGMP